MTGWVVSFPEPAKQLNMNDRMHWRTKARATRTWRRAAYFATVDAINRHDLHRDLPRSFVQLSLPVTSLAGRRDPSNWAPTTKATVDGIVDAGAWSDDDSTHVITLEPAFHPVRRDRGARIVRVSIRPVTLDTLDEAPW